MTGKRFQILQTNNTEIVNFGAYTYTDSILVHILECIGYEYINSEHSMDFDIFIEQAKPDGHISINKSKYYGKKIFTAEEIFKAYIPPHKVTHPHKNYTYTSYINGDFHKTIIPMLLSTDEASNLLGYQWMLKNLTFDEFAAMMLATRLNLAPYNTIMSNYIRDFKNSTILGQLICGLHIKNIQQRFQNAKKISNN